MVRHSNRALEIIDRFLAKAPDLDPALLDYARACRSGCIQ
jgi:hypothetical protein